MDFARPVRCELFLHVVGYTELNRDAAEYDRKSDAVEETRNLKPRAKGRDWEVRCDGEPELIWEFVVWL